MTISSNHKQQDQPRHFQMGLVNISLRENSSKMLRDTCTELKTSY